MVHKDNKTAAQRKKQTLSKKQTVTYYYHKICQYLMVQPWLQQSLLFELSNSCLCLYFWCCTFAHLCCKNWVQKPSGLSQTLKMDFFEIVFCLLIIVKFICNKQKSNWQNTHNFGISNTVSHFWFHFMKHVFYQPPQNDCESLSGSEWLFMPLVNLQLKMNKYKLLLLMVTVKLLFNRGIWR